jgi:hypothetical protein
MSDTVSLFFVYVIAINDRESRLPEAFTTEGSDSPQCSKKRGVTVDDGSSLNDLKESSGF